MRNYNLRRRAKRPDEPATAAQLDLLRELGAKPPAGITKKLATKFISTLIRAREWERSMPSEGQKRRLQFYGIDCSARWSRDDAGRIIDQYIKEHPESERAYHQWKRSQGIQDTEPKHKQQKPQPLISSSRARPGPWISLLNSGIRLAIHLSCLFLCVVGSGIGCVVGDKYKHTIIGMLAGFALLFVAYRLFFRWINKRGFLRT